MLENIIIILVLALIIGLAAWYVIKAKKRGIKCIGCPDGANCGKNGVGGCGGNCSGCGGCNK